MRCRSLLPACSLPLAPDPSQDPPAGWGATQREGRSSASFAPVRSTTAAGRRGVRWDGAVGRRWLPDPEWCWDPDPPPSTPLQCWLHAAPLVGISASPRSLQDKERPPQPLRSSESPARSGRGHIPTRSPISAFREEAAAPPYPVCVENPSWCCQRGAGAVRPPTGMLRDLLGAQPGKPYSRVGRDGEASPGERCSTPAHQPRMGTAPTSPTAPTATIGDKPRGRPAPSPYLRRA